MCFAFPETPFQKPFWMLFLIQLFYTRNVYMRFLVNEVNTLAHNGSSLVGLKFAGFLGLSFLYSKSKLSTFRHFLIWLSMRYNAMLSSSKNWTAFYCWYTDLVERTGRAAWFQLFHHFCTFFVLWRRHVEIFLTFRWLFYPRW